MFRRTLLSALFATALAAGAVEAGVTQDRIVAELREQGFSRIEIGRTLLGRVRIVAIGDGVRREIVFNPGSGVILRDFWQDSGRDGSSGGSIIDSRTSSSGSDDADDDDDDDDDSGSDSDDSDDDDDDSGSGSDDSDDDDNSGSGSDDSDDDDDDD